MATKKEAETKETKRGKQPKKTEKNMNGYFMYQGKPLLRCGNEIYYGDTDAPYVVVFRLMEQEPLGDLQIAKRVIIELKTNEGKKSRLIRQAERDGLYKAFDIGMFWLEQALEADQQQK